MKRLHRWWEGKYIPPDNPPNTPVFILQGQHERHWTARAAHACWGYFRAHHQWIIGMAVAIALALLVKMRS